MITCESLTVEKVTAELALLEAAYKAERNKRAAKVRAAEVLHGKDSQEWRNESASLEALTQAYRDYGRRLRAVLGVLEEEASLRLQSLLAAVMEAHTKQAAEPKPEGEEKQ